MPPKRIAEPDGIDEGESSALFSGFDINNGEKLMKGVTTLIGYFKRAE